MVVVVEMVVVVTVAVETVAKSGTYNSYASFSKHICS